MEDEDTGVLEEYATFHAEMARLGVFQGNRGRLVTDAKLYCPTCGDRRRMNVVDIALKSPPDHVKRKHTGSGQAGGSSYTLECVECRAVFYAILYVSATGPDIVILSAALGGHSTPHTPDGVRYYLDQAHRSETMGARSAAIAMYRSALECLLFEQGFKKSMLGAKLAALDAAISDGTAPRWARDLEPEFLEVMKDLGNAAIHPNDGDIKRQEHLDADLMLRVKALFEELLDLVYEAHHRRAANLAKLKAARDGMQDPALVKSTDSGKP